MTDTTGSDHPLGNPDAPDLAKVALVEPSILDTILDLDAFLSADVRRPEKTARICTKPDLEAKLDELDAQLAALTDSSGKPLADPEPSLGGAQTQAHVIAQQIRDLEQEYADAFRSIRVRAMPSDDWEAFQERHRDTLAGDPPYARAMWDELITTCAVAPTINAEQITKLRKSLSHRALDVVASAAWSANTTSGVSIPKSRRSSLVLQPNRPGKS